MNTKLLIGVAALAAMGTPAFAADMPLKAPPVVAPVLYSWTGFYVGGNLGYSWGRANTDLTETTQTTTTATITTLAGTPIASATVVGTPVVFRGSHRTEMDGWLGGFQAGYNYQVNRWVWGVEGDLQATGERGGTNFCFPENLNCGPGTAAGGTASYRLRWLGTLRGRVGYAWDRVLFYATGGLAVGQIDASYTDSIAASTLTPLTTVAVSSTATRAGWVAGAGVEGAFRNWNNWTWKIEYLHVDLGGFNALAAGSATGAFSAVIGDFRTSITQTTAFNSAYHSHFSDDIIRVGVNYRFGAAPVVVAKY
jgi:outer membrane immunogenic protein